MKDGDDSARKYEQARQQVLQRIEAARYATIENTIEVQAKQAARQQAGFQIAAEVAMKPDALQPRKRVPSNSEEAAPRNREVPKARAPIAARHGQRGDPNTLNREQQAADQEARQAVSEAISSLSRGGIRSAEAGGPPVAKKAATPRFVHSSAVPPLAEASRVLPVVKAVKAATPRFANSKPTTPRHISSGGKTQADIRAAFALFDRDDSGTLTVDELVGIMTDSATDRPLSLAEAEAFIRKFDRNGDGELDLDEVSCVQLVTIRRGIGKLEASSLPSFYLNAPFCMRVRVTQVQSSTLIGRLCLNSTRCSSPVQ